MDKSEARFLDKIEKIWHRNGLFCWENMLQNTRQERMKLCNELDTLVEILDEHIDTFCQRIEFIQKGEYGKARFIDEKVLPTIDRRLQDQVSKIEQQISTEGTNHESKES